jgi:tetratricopeptide (TPR) repeat protein
VTKFRFGGILLWAVIFFGLPGIDCEAQEEKRRSAAFHYRVGEVALEKQNWTKAKDAFDACLRENAFYYDAYYSRAIVHDHFDSLNKALTDYNIYLEYRPDHHEALFGRAQVRMRLNQYELAKGDLLKMLDLPPGETTAIFFRQDVTTGTVDQMFTTRGRGNTHIYNAIGEVDMKLEKYDEAILYFDSALHASPKDPDILVNRAKAYEKKLDTAAAIADYQRALRVDRQHGVAKHNLDLITNGKNIPDDETRWYDEAIEDNPNTASPYAERAYMYFEKENYPKALKDYDRAISLDATEPAYFLNRGLIKEMLKDEQGAYNDYTSAIKLKNNFEKAWLNRGYLQAKLGKLKEAIDDYSSAIRHSPEFASAYYNRAVAHNRLQEKDLACNDLRAAERLGLPIDAKVKKSICGN